MKNSLSVALKDLAPNHRVDATQVSSVYGGDINELRLDRATVGAEDKVVSAKWHGHDGHGYEARLVRYGYGPWDAEDPEEWPWGHYYLVWSATEYIDGYPVDDDTFCGLVHEDRLLSVIVNGHARPIPFYPAHVLWVY